MAKVTQQKKGLSKEDVVVSFSGEVTVNLQGELTLEEIETYAAKHGWGESDLAEKLRLLIDDEVRGFHRKKGFPQFGFEIDCIEDLDNLHVDVDKTEEEVEALDSEVKAGLDSLNCNFEEESEEAA